MLNKDDMAWVQETAKKIKSKMEWVCEKSKYKIPYTTINGTHDNMLADENMFGHSDINWWTNGFWGGMMWLMYHQTQDEKYAEIAKFSEEKLDKCFEDYYGLHHDVGFMWLLTAIADFRLTKDEAGRRRGMHAANLLAGRFNPVGKFIRAWNDEFGQGKETKGWAIIDCMMNLPLLYWASEESQDPRFKQIAMLHADTAMEVFIRQDGSVNHIVEFNPLTGEVVTSYGGQGYGEGSSWTRGQSWALYGFIISYIHTGKIEYLNTAKRVAHYFVSNIPENGIVPVDFRQPEEPVLEDSTAAAIAACGLIEISKNVNELERHTYMNAALKLLKTLDNSRCDWSKDCDCILQKCTGSYHDNKHHFCIIYGDYYFMEAIFKLKGNDVFLW